MTTAVHPEGLEESAASTGEHMLTKLVVRGKATSEKIDKLFEIFKLVLTDAKFDAKAKVIELLREKRSRLESSIQSSGHSMVNSRMKAKYRVGGYIDEIMGGISYLDTVKDLLKTAESDWPSLLARFEKMRDTILGEDYCRSGMVLDITGDAAVLESIKPSIQLLLASLPGKGDGESLPDFYNEIHPWVPEARKGMEEMEAQGDEGFIVPTQVSYVGKIGQLYNEGEEVPGSAAVVAKFLRTGYLWDHVRVMGGAYGGFCSFSPFSGLLSFLSYRDPNLEKTLDIYDAAAGALFEAADAMESDPVLLETAIIGTIGDMDGALSPDQKGYTAFQRWLVNESPRYRQKFRNEVLETKPSDFRDFAERLKNLGKPSVAVVSSKGAFETAEEAGRKMKLTVVL
jgi:presequence protease